VNKLSGDLIQAVIALRIQGFKDVDIAKQLDTSQPNISRLESNHPEAFAKAEIHALTQYERKFKINLLGVRAALSEAGPRLVQVLIEIAENPTLKENVRKDAAIAGLNLMGVGYTRTSYGGKDSTLNPGSVNTFIQNNLNKEAEYAAVTSDVIDAEIVEENS
jgi:orotate phosphoribosyltransferase-like protein